MKYVWLGLAGFVGLVLTIAMLIMPDWDLPPVDNEQTGYRGTAMVQIGDRERNAALAALNEVPEPIWEADQDGPRASEVYENVPVLGHLSADEFDMIMASITEWVSPEEGCNYCHLPEDLAADDIYTKQIARHMFEMTWAINSQWTDHVQETGATCYTCHRGEPIPAHHWFNQEAPGPTPGMFGYTAGQNTVAVGLTSMQSDPYTGLLDGDGEIRVESLDALPTDHAVSIPDTEKTYALMIHMSESLGVNCTYCHNTRALQDWQQSTPARMTAWHGIQMVRDLNTNHLGPLSDTFPEERLGPMGDVAKANCATCHQGVAKPLGGVPMVADYPSLLTPP